MNGGYLTVSLKNYDFSKGGRLYVEDIYKTITNSNYKAVMLCDIMLNGERKQNVYSAVERKDNSIIIYAYGYAITITDTDIIDAIPNSGDSGGLSVLELDTFPTLDGVAMSDSDNAKLTAAIGKPVIIRITDGDFTFVLVFSYYENMPFRAFACSIGILNVAFQSSDGLTWTGQQGE